MSIGTRLLAATAMVLALGTPLRAADLTAETVLATVNGQEITLGHLIALHDSLPAAYMTLPNEVLFEGILNQLVQQTALAQIAEKDISKADQARIEVDRRSYLAAGMLDRVAGTAVTDEAVATAYEAQFVAAEPAREYNAAHILVATEAEAAAIRAELEAGADFAQTAKLKSTDGAAPEGGALGWFTLDVMVEPFAAALAPMQPGELAGPVQTEYGWHLIKLNETRLTEVPAIEDVRADLETGLRNTAIEERLAEVVAQAEVVKMTDGIDPAVLKDTTIFGN
ncbi:MAG: peptidylprolyl isomerase [Pseudorhodobacter sp.]|nr:peptidylprolyl isomerase [Pseudorhodobacter sp.]